VWSRMVHHPFREVLLLLVGAGDRIAALDVAVLAAGDILRRAGRAGMGAAIAIVILGQAGRHRCAIARDAGGERERDERDEEEVPRCLPMHAVSLDLIGALSTADCGICKP